jgi:GNAT superfamily N-acetyltransferase
MIIKRSKIDEVSNKIWRLFEKHREEITTNKELMQIKPYYDVYRSLEEKGDLIILEAFEGEELIGYSVNFITPHWHYADLIVCVNDLLYVEDKYRNHKAGLALMLETEKAAKESGAKIMSWHAKEKTALAEILKKKEYKIQDIIFNKVL